MTASNLEQTSVASNVDGNTVISSEALSPANDVPNVRRRFQRRNSVVKTMLSESSMAMIPSECRGISPANDVAQTPTPASFEATTPQTATTNVNVRRRFQRRNSVVKTMLCESSLTMFPSESRGLKRTNQDVSNETPKVGNMFDDIALSVENELKRVNRITDTDDKSSKRSRHFYDMPPSCEHTKSTTPEISFKSSTLFASCA
eukprot:CAMPEP_0194357128 /NCGR_PEP_ID=MMETSP0174-20130528/4660_1 /TAXON_ID=216777 /ORGANISM="Proboscia alata, Strain PI-D3" /LENGTH=202 /DNA_ID=CAMNT_0039127021 /DNA_START=121 /DNA_END=729 /DNA_ORIENTATION=-